MNPHDWQVPNVRAIVESVREFGVAADSSGTGAGKTVMSLAAAKDLGLRPYVAAPKSVLPSWAETMRRMGVDGSAINYERLVRSSSDAGRWVIRKRRWEWNLPEGSILIFDEAHRLGSPTSQTSKLLVAAVRQGIPVILLSATLADSPLKMRAIGYALGLCAWEWNAWQAWLLIEGGCYRGDFNRIEFTGSETFKAGVMRRIREKAGRRMTGIDTSQVPGFPESLVVPLELPVSVSASKIDRAYEEDLERLREEAELLIVQDLRGRQLAEWGKKEAILELAKDKIEEGLSVVIFVNFLETLEWLREKLGCEAIHGGDEDRQGAIDRFQSNVNHALVVQIASGGVGISLHDHLKERQRISIISPGFSAVDLIQALGRICRSGGSNVTQYIVTAEGSAIEKRVYRAIRAKAGSIRSLTNSDLAI